MKFYVPELCIVFLMHRRFRDFIQMTILFKWGLLTSIRYYRQKPIFEMKSDPGLSDLNFFQWRDLDLFLEGGIQFILEVPIILECLIWIRFFSKVWSGSNIFSKAWSGSNFSRSSDPVNYPDPLRNISGLRVGLATISAWSATLRL